MRHYEFILINFEKLSPKRFKVISAEGTIQVVDKLLTHIAELLEVYQTAKKQNSKLFFDSKIYCLLFLK